MKKLTHKQQRSFLPPDLFSRNTVISSLIEILFKETENDVKALDVGGRESRLNWFLPESVKYTILDKSPKSKHDDCEYKQGDANKIPFSDRNFDIVISSDMLEHIDKPFRAPVIREMLRVSKNYLLLGVPVESDLVSKAENIVNKQYKSASLTDHPFLKEHLEFGLPKEEKIDEILKKEKVSFIKIREGNLMSWYIQQLYSSVLNGEDLQNKKYEFYKFFNENLFSLGNLRVPTYRVFYLIAKDSVLPDEKDINLMSEKHQWNPEIFMNALEKAFDDIRTTIENKKELLQKEKEISEEEKAQLTMLMQAFDNINVENEMIKDEYEDLLKKKSEKIVQLEGSIKKATTSLSKYREVIEETRLFLREKALAFDELKEKLESKNKEIEVLKENEKELKNSVDIMKKQILELESSVDVGKKQILELEKKKLELKNSVDVLNNDLVAHQNELRKVVNSRAWKLVMFYSKIKLGVKNVGKGVLGLFKNFKKGWDVLTVLGPKTFFKKLINRVKKNKIVGSEYDLYLEERKLKYISKSKAIKEIERFEYKPLISVVMPVYNVDTKWLVKAVESVKKQWYGRFELCICNDASSVAGIKWLLDDYSKNDKRIKVVHRQHNGGIVKASNSALKLATGAYVTFLDHDDELAPEALYEVVKSLQVAGAGAGAGAGTGVGAGAGAGAGATRPDLIYTDEDKIDEAGKRSEPFFKPVWSPDLLLSQNYICHLAVYRRKLLEELNNLKEGFDGSQDYDLLLRFTEKTDKIHHIPEILYHWRKIKGSVALDIDAKPYAFTSAKKALNQALKRRGIKGTVEDGIWKGSYRVKREIIGEPLVSIIIPFRDKPKELKACVNSVFSKTNYKNFELLLVDNLSKEKETQDFLDSITDERVKKLNYSSHFNFSAINNFASKKAKGEYLVFLNNDTEVISKEWISAMLEHSQRKEVGVVGAKLLYPNNLVQHAGVLIGVGGIANSSFSKLRNEDHGYFGQADVIRNYSAVTGACMMVSKELFSSKGGFNEHNLAVAFNDVDFCLRLREEGYLIVYTPFAKLYHHESLSRGYDVDLNEIAYMERSHRAVIKNGDPYYNPNLTRERLDFSMKVSDK